MVYYYSRIFNSQLEEQPKKNCQCSFVSELLTILATTIANIEPHQIHTYYESGRNHITRMERTIPLFHQLHYTRHHLNTLTVEILYSLAGKPS